MTFATGTLEAGTMYNWRIDEVTDTDTVAGTVWQFTTERPATDVKDGNAGQSNG